MISKSYRLYWELRIKARRARIQDMKGWSEIDHRKDVADQSCKSKVLKQLSIWIGFVVKLTSFLDRHITETKAIPYLFLDDTV